jgi:hypothetical protein
MPLMYQKEREEVRVRRSYLPKALKDFHGEE